MDHASIHFSLVDRSVYLYIDPFRSTRILNLSVSPVSICRTIRSTMTTCWRLMPIMTKCKSVDAVQHHAHMGLCAAIPVASEQQTISADRLHTHTLKGGCSQRSPSVIDRHWHMNFDMIESYPPQNKHSPRGENGTEILHCAKDTRTPANAIALYNFKCLGKYGQ